MNAPGSIGKLARLLLAAAITAVAQQPAADATKPAPHRRLALLIANGAYQHVSQSQSSMPNLKAIRPALEAAGFQIYEAYDFTLARMLKEIEAKFLEGVKPGDVCFVFFAGHVVQSGDDNYLLPVDFDPARPGSIDQKARSVIGLQQALDTRRAGLKMIVLDPVRQDPKLLALSTGPGLTLPDVTDVQDVIYAFSTSPNSLSPEANSPEAGAFAKTLAGVLQRPGLGVVEVFSAVQGEVGRATSQAQIPFFLSKTTQTFLFRNPEPKTTVTPVSLGRDQIRPNRVDRQEYVFLPAATFKMGCVPKDTRCAAPEKPQHRVKLSSGFWIGRTEVEISAYQRYAETEKKKMPAAPLWDRKWRLANHPMTQVNWEEAEAYCAWAGGRLPTEAEWEYAARAGAADQIYPLDDENSRDKANFSGKKENDRYDYTAPVRSFDPNAFGLFDLAGNVWEWVSDWYAEDYYAHAEPTDPKGPADGKSHVVRGGSWDSDPKEHLRISYRQTYPKGGNKVGFRCVLPDSEKIREQLLR